MLRSLALLLLVALTAAGCKTDKLEETAQDQSQKPSQSDVVLVEGEVYFGALADGEVTIHPLHPEGYAEESVIGVGRTDADGRFSVAIDAKYQALPAVIRASAGDSAELVCDLPAGCQNGIPFGARYSAPADLHLFLAVPHLQATSFHNVSVPSSLAFWLIEEKLRSHHASAPAVSLSMLQAHINGANTQVASRFGIVGDLASFPFVHLTNAAHVQQASADAVEASILMVGALQAISKSKKIDSVDSLQIFSTQFNERGIAGVSEAAGLLSFSNVLREAVIVAQRLQLIYEKDFGSVIGELEASSGLVELELPGQYSRGTPSETAVLTSLEKAKAFVLDIRKVASSINLRKLVGLGSLSSLLDGDTSELLSEFGMPSTASNPLAGEVGDQLTAAVEFALQAAARSLMNYYADSVVESTYEGMSFEYTVTQDIHIFRFRSAHDLCRNMPNACPVQYNLNVVAKVDRFTGNGQTRTFAPAQLDMTIEGSVAAANQSLNFLAANQQVRFVKPSISLGEELESDANLTSIAFSAEAFRVRVPFSVDKMSDAGEETLTGVLSLESRAVNLKFESEKVKATEEDGGVTTVTDSTIFIQAMEGFKASFASSLTGPEGDFAGSVNIRQGTEAVVEPVTIRSHAVDYCGVSGDACKALASETVVEGESPEQFVRLHASVGFKAKLKGIASPVILEISGSRDSPTTNTINNMKVNYPGHAVSLNGKFNNKGGITALDAVNLDGMHLYLNTVGDKRSGVLETANKEKVADLIDMGQWVKIRYLDGYFESL